MLKANMPRKTGSKRPRQQNGERLFAVVAFVVSLVIAAGFCGLLFALNRQGQTPETSIYDLPDSQPIIIQPDHLRQLVKFSLTNQDGQTVTRADLKGKFLVVSFLFTSCSLTCPIVSHQMETIQQLTTNLPDVQLVSLTVDPEDDTVPVLSKYGQRFDADANRWLFLTGDETTVHNLIGTSFLSPDTNDVFSYMPGNFAHIERIALVDPQGRVREYFDGLGNGTPEAVVNEIKQLKK
ncbi:MAG: SCO family protein [Limisphaerales bacterium]